MRTPASHRRLIAFMDSRDPEGITRLDDPSPVRCSWAQHAYVKGMWVQKPCFREATWVADNGKSEMLLCPAHKGKATREANRSLTPNVTFTRLDDWMAQRRSTP